jgi:hypothetical protein
MSISDLVVAAGKITLVGGTATLTNTAVSARDVVIITSAKAVGAAYVSAESYNATVTAGQVVFNALDLANPAALVATDVSVLNYIIFRGGVGSQGR